MLELARTITLGAILRDESRGAHYKPEFPGAQRRKVLEDHQGQLYGRLSRARALSWRKWTRSTSSRVSGATKPPNDGARRCQPRRRSEKKTGALAPEETMAKKTVTFEIRRQANPDAPAVWETFETGVAAGHERHLRDDGDRRQPGDCGRKADHAHHLRLELP